MTHSIAYAQRGLSLVELMVGITIGLLLIAGLFTLFATSSLSTNEFEKSIRQFENGQYAVDLLSEDLNHAGFYADLLPPASAPTYVAPGVCTTAIGTLGWSPLIGTSIATAPTAIIGLSSTEVDSLTCLPHHKPNTPAVVVRRLDTTAVTPSTTVPGSVYVQSSRCTSSTSTFVIAVAVSGSPAIFPLQMHDCATVAPVRRYISRVYYIASCSECGLDLTPTLTRAELTGTDIVISPMVEGIDDISFEFGFDTSKANDPSQFDGIPDEYRLGLSGSLGANNNDWKNVVSVRTYLLTRTLEPTSGYVENKIYSLGLAGTRGPYADGYKRRAYSFTSRLHNVAQLREGT